MLTRTLSLEEKDLYNQVVSHPLQTWEWGEFKKTMAKKSSVSAFLTKDS